MTATTYRDARAGDAAAVAALARRTFTETFGHLYAPADLALFLDRHTADAWAAEIADTAYAVRLVEANGAIVGYAKLGPPSLPFTPEHGAIELRQLYVLSTFHSGGVAPALMDWIVATARLRGARALYLSVFVDNHRARRFYARYGFEEVGPYTFMVGSHEDEDIVMRLAL